MKSFLIFHFRNASWCQDQNFDETACISCSACSKKTCSTCSERHACKDSLAIPDIFDDRKDSFHALCKQHGAPAENICIDCGNQFLCLYCSNKEHIGHYQDSMENQATVIKNNLTTDFEEIRNNVQTTSILYQLVD